MNIQAIVICGAKCTVAMAHPAHAAALPCSRVFTFRYAYFSRDAACQNALSYDDDAE